MHGGIGAQATGWIEVGLWRGLSLQREYKFTWASPEIDVAGGEATIPSRSHTILDATNRQLRLLSGKTEGDVTRLRPRMAEVAAHHPVRVRGSGRPPGSNDPHRRDPQHPIADPLTTDVAAPVVVPGGAGVTLTVAHR